MKNLQIITFFFVFSCCSCTTNTSTHDAETEWLPASLLREKSATLQINGDPQLVDSPYVEAVYFDGIDDALFLDEMPLKSLQEFTVEMIFRPDTNSQFEQRILHFGEVSDDRLLLEIRAVENNWYFDAFVASGSNKKPLIDEQLTHSLGQWHHVAFVVGPENLSTFVNGKQELTTPFSFNPIVSGRSSIGVRLNKRSWFKGTIYKIRVSPKQLQPADFLTFQLN